LGAWWLEGMCLRIDGLGGYFWWLARGEKCGLCGFKNGFWIVGSGGLKIGSFGRIFSEW
jgi:hypothetical protein